MGARPLTVVRTLKSKPLCVLRTVRTRYTQIAMGLRRRCPSLAAEKAIGGGVAATDKGPLPGSSRAPKEDKLKTTKFSESEKVLCFEPDPTKVRVIYDAKILRVSTVHPKEKCGGGGAEEGELRFLVHFLGWNASWDRFVPENFLLKNTPTNREMQKDLADSADLVKKNVKKSSLLTSKKRPASADNDVTAATAGGNLRDGGATIQDNAVDFFSVRLQQLPEGLQHHLEEDYLRVSSTKENHLMINHCSNVVEVLDEYVRWHAISQLVTYEKQRNKTFYTAYRREGIKQYFDNAIDSISLCKEVAEGLGIMLDFYLERHLLYQEERETWKKLQQESIAVAKRPRKKQNRNQTAGNDDNPDEPLHLQHPCNLTTPEAKQVLRSIGQWQLLPRKDVETADGLPCVLCGPIYLLRLLVKLPEIFGRMQLTPSSKKSKLIIKYVDSVVEFLDSHPHLFEQR